MSNEDSKDVRAAAAVNDTDNNSDTGTSPPPPPLPPQIASYNNMIMTGGPPDPIDYLRQSVTRTPSGNIIDMQHMKGRSLGEIDWRRFDSDEEVGRSREGTDDDDDDDNNDGGDHDKLPKPMSSPDTTSASPHHHQPQSQQPQGVVPPQRQQKIQEEEPPARERPSQGEVWPYRETLSFTRSLVFYGAGSINTAESVRACELIQQARALRHKYHHHQFGTSITTTSSSVSAATATADSGRSEGSSASTTTETAAATSNDSGSSATNSTSDSLEAVLGNGGDLKFRMGTDGTAELFRGDDENFQNNLLPVPNIDEFSRDYAHLVEMVSEGAMRSFCFQRLQLLSSSFKMHTTVNGTIEREEQSNLLGTDFYRTMKVDNHIHAAAAPSAKQFVEYVRRKLDNEGDTVVLENGKTLAQVFEEAGLDKDHLTIDAFDVLADYSIYKRFDNFNSKYSPFRLAEMRRIFLKTDNHIGGRYFAELLKIVIDRHEKAKGHNSACEMRLSIYGMNRNEWLNLAKWILRDWDINDIKDFPGPIESTNNRWHIQIPRLWRIYSQKPVKPDKDGRQPKRSFMEMIENLFVPIFEATLYPNKHPEVAELLTHIVGFDSVDDEGALEDSSCACHRPHEWTSEKNPSYWWQLYYLWSNLQVLNRLRQARGLNTIAFRPHAGETGDPLHLAATYMLCQSINHGIGLDMQVSLQYLYYLDQIGLSISPLSNNFLFTKIARNPFSKFFRRGMNVTISTDDPLLFHMSDDALLEEYSVARSAFDLSMTDMMEIARNSVLQSGFDEDFKQRWLGPNYQRGLTHCDENITHVPLIRAKFRAEHLALEHMMVHLIAAGKGDTVLREMKLQFSNARDAHRDVLFENFSDVPSFPERGQL